MKVNVQPRIGLTDPMLMREWIEHANQINALSEGRMVAYYSALTSVPTSGTYALGDFVMNSNPSELGTAGSKYIVHGWRCVASGTPGTWVQCRFLTGN